MEGAFAAVCRAAGLSEAQARARAEEAVVAIEGALIVAADTGDTNVFVRTLDRLRDRLLTPAQGS